METKLISGAEKLANISRTLGLWTGGILTIQILLILLLGINVNQDVGFVVGCLCSLLGIGGFLLGLPACIIALIALWMNRKESNDASIRRKATIGLVLGVIPVVFISIGTLIYLFS